MNISEIFGKGFMGHEHRPTSIDNHFILGIINIGINLPENTWKMESGNM
jgi:hypothetical protein